MCGTKDLFKVYNIFYVEVMLIRCRSIDDDSEGLHVVLGTLGYSGFTMILIKSRTVLFLARHICTKVDATSK
jgi:hypothetical protein